MTSYELFAYTAVDGAVVSSSPERFVVSSDDKTAVKQRAGRLAKKIGGPVDIAYLDDRSWEERYITTAVPSEFHSSGYSFERLD